MSELKLYEISEEYISYISTVEKIFSLQKKMTETISESIWASCTALTGIAITFLFPHLKILITDWKTECRKSAGALSLLSASHPNPHPGNWN